MRIRFKISFAFLIVSIIVMSISGGVIGYFTNTTVKEKTYSYLYSSGRARAEHVRSFLQGQKETTNILAGTLSVEEFLTSNSLNSDYTSKRELLKECFDKIIEKDSNIFEIFVLDQGGKIVLSTDETQLTKDKSQDKYFIEGSKGTYIKDVYISESIKKENYTVSSPVKDDASGTLLGVMVIRFNPDSFYSIVVAENGLGSSEESFLINKDYYFLSPSRFLGNSVILNRKVETENARKCFDQREIDYVTKNGYSGLQSHLGNKGYVESKDYRNADVIATHEYIPETGWCLITKVDKSEALKLNYQLLYISLIILGVSIIVIIATSIYISKKVTQPIINLKNEMDKVEEGDLNVKVASDEKDEIGDLSRNFGDMISAVKESRANIEQKVAEQTADIKEKLVMIKKQEGELQKYQMAIEGASDHIVITDHNGIVLYANKGVERITGFPVKEVIGKKAGSKELWGGLMDKKIYEKFWKTIKQNKKSFSGVFNNKRKDGQEYEAAANVSPILDKNGKVVYFVGIERDITKEKEIDRAKSEFVSLASHQLRTPATAVKQFIGMLLEEYAGKLSKEQKELVQDAYDSNERQLQIVNDLLETARIEAGTMTLDITRFDVVRLCNHVVLEQKHSFENKKQKLIFEKPKKPIDMTGDEHKIRMVIDNLVNNANKYTPDGGIISLVLEKEKNNLKIIVSDNGIGISPNDQKELFQKFHRIKGKDNKNVEGSGLGLYIVKEIITLHKGIIKIDSAVGKGTKFTITLPTKGA